MTDTLASPPQHVKQIFKHNLQISSEEFLFVVFYEFLRIFIYCSSGRGQTKKTE